jgi:hypothetical protein
MKITLFCAFCTKMEFLGISLTKDSSLLLNAIHSHFYWKILKKTMLFSGFKNLSKKIRETRKLESIHELHFVKQKDEGRKQDKNSSLRRCEFMLRNLNEKLPFKNSISVHAYCLMGAIQL